MRTLTRLTVIAVLAAVILLGRGAFTTTPCTYCHPTPTTSGTP